MAVSSSEEQEEETLIEEKETEMVSPPFGGNPTVRIAHFLKPPSKNSKTLINPFPQSTSPSKPISSILKSLNSKVHFHGWRFPQKNWCFWVEKLRSKFQSIWKKASIFEAIMGTTTLEIPRYNNSIFALAEKWDPQTNTFVFSWGEVSITLEDVMVLGGYSVTGDSVLSKVSDEIMVGIEVSLKNARLSISRSKDKRASQHVWMAMWMDSGHEFEHEAFLALWLSRYVLPSGAHATMNKYVFHIAVLLARGTKIALAPAVLASIYRDLRLLKVKIDSVRELSGVNGVNDVNVITRLNLWAPFPLLLVWFWERFPAFSPKSNEMVNGMPRLMRWNKVKILRKNDVSLAIDLAGDGFRWRPYSTHLDNWSFDLDLESYYRCIRASDLVGMNCVELYCPHRVAMQFGLDQDIPFAFPCLSDSRADAWRNYSRPIGDIKLYVPPKVFESGVTMRYLEWWKESKVVKENANLAREKGYAEPTTKLHQGSSKMSEKGRAKSSTKPCLYTVKISGKGNPSTRPCQGTLETSVIPVEKVRIKMENNEAEVPPGFSPKGKRVTAVDFSDELQPTCKRSKRSPSCTVTGIESNESDAFISSSFQIKGVKVEVEVVDFDGDH